MASIRETLRRLEDEGMYYTDEPYPDEYWLVWVDEVEDIFYAYETDNLDLRVDELTDEDLKDIITGRL